MSALLFGSISTIADTSELQREAYNRAFEAHGLEWNWDRDRYRSMLDSSGGKNRIAAYAESVGQDVDAQAVHETKSELFQRGLASAQVSPRDGVVDSIQGAKAHGWKIALVTTTSQANIDALLDALSPQIRRGDFDLVVDASSVDQPKPAPDAYRFAVEAMSVPPGDCVAVEDNVGGVRAAAAADIACVAFPNENTAGHDFGDTRVVDRLEIRDLTALVG